MLRIKDTFYILNNSTKINFLLHDYSNVEWDYQYFTTANTVVSTHISHKKIEIYYNLI